MSTLRSSALWCLVLAGCGVSAEKIERWKSTDEGREKLVTALRDEKLPLERRVHAGAALTEVGWTDRIESALAALTIDERDRVIPALAPAIARHLDVPAHGSDAREALVGLRRQATTDQATKAVDAVLLPALERDLRAGRKEAGRHPMVEVLTAIGPPALPLVQRVLDDGKSPFAIPVEVVTKIGDEPARDAAAKALVMRARAATPVPADLWRALSSVGGAPAADFLEERVKTGDQRAAAADALTELAKNKPVPKSVLPFVLGLAQDTATPPALREKMFAIAENFRGKDTRKGLLPIISGDPDPAIRLRAYDALLTANGGPAVLDALEALPLGASYKPQEVMSRLVGKIASLGYGAREMLGKTLESRSPLARMAAIWAFEKTGFASDAAPLAKLTADKGAIKGFPRAQTVGAEATRVADKLKKQGS
jgi:hypothetical protein